ncbi:hypothetical protein ASF71_09980 [Deinococcus sp. Leaf326]|nr:hypothetical protein ASF71_09980 [Deinococcus sp. Leaf326]
MYSEILKNNSFYSIVQPAITNYHPDDIEFEYIKDDNGVIRDIVIKTPDVEVFAPQLTATGCDLKSLIKMRAQMGSTQFLREYQNDISSFLGSSLKEEWLNYVDETPALNELDLYMGVDLAITEKQSSDFTVIVTIGKHKKTGLIYLLKLNRVRSDFPTTIENIKKEYGYWKTRGFTPKKVMIETVAFQLATFQTLRASTNIPVVKSNSLGKKEERINSMAVFFENGKVNISKDFDPEELFKTEWLNFPSKKTHDDILDAVEISLRAVLSTSSGKTIQYTTY